MIDQGHGMWADIKGGRKKVACRPCIRGHRASKCDHRDRILIEVRKPGRPLTSCPHVRGPCGCERMITNVAIPTESWDRDSPVNSSGIQKIIQKKRRTTQTALVLEKAIEASHIHDADSDASSEPAVTSKPTLTLTNPVLAVSEPNHSNEAFPPSRKSSTPLPQSTPSREQGSDVGAKPSLETSLAEITTDGQVIEGLVSSTSPILKNAQMSQGLSDHCNLKSTRRKSTPYQPQQAGRNQDNIQEAEELPKLVELPRLVQLPKRREISMQPIARESCCMGPVQAAELEFISQMHGPQDVYQPFPNFPQLPERHPWPHKVSIRCNHSTGTAMNSRSHPSDYTMLPLPYPFNPLSNIQVPSSYHQPDRTTIPPTHHATNCSDRKIINNNYYCGHPCSCFGCAAQPNDAVVTEYAWLMHHHMSTGGLVAFPPRYNLDTDSHQVNHGGAENEGQLAFNTNVPTSFMQRAPEHLLYAMSMKNMRDTANSSFNVLAPRQQGALEPPAQTLLLPNAQYLSASIQHQKQSTLTSRVGETAGETAARPLAAETPDDDDEEEDEEEAPTLSPSSYFAQEIVLPGCSDGIGACECSDGCRCVGCVTHPSHKSVSCPTTTKPDVEHFSTTEFSKASV